ncbi:hypothetical protein QX776_02370 [Alteromonadaceae bacterium BrNp21-10]|nr:hypothetical protein [Alteromonadaceae bacterium BrNp21-10]
MTELTKVFRTRGCSLILKMINNRKIALKQWLVLASCLLLGCTTQATPQLAFDSAKGFGQYTQGGHNGQLYIVNTLEDDPDDPKEGSLRHALKRKYPRTVVFSVSGIINLKAPLIVKSGHLTIAGQTSPGGITVTGAPVKVSDAEQVIIRYMRFRLGTFTFPEDAMTVRDSQDVIIDHCSFSWSVDEAASFYNNSRFTLQNSIISNSLNDSIHPKGKHGYGGIWGGNQASFINNVIAHHNSRTPRLNGHRLKSPYAQQYEFVEVANNVIFNWGSNNIYGSENGRFNLINNVFKPGPASKKHQFADIWHSPELKTAQAYVSGNYYVGGPDFTAKNWLGVKFRSSEKGKAVTAKQNNPRLSPTPLTPVDKQDYVGKFASVDNIYQQLIVDKDSGANRNANGLFWDSVDSLVLAQIDGEAAVEGKGLINHEFEMIGNWKNYQQQFDNFPAVIDANHDGINDAWAAAHPTQSSDLNAYLADLAN